MSLSETNKSTPSSEFQENLEILRQIYFFSGLPLETLKIFAYLCTREKFKPEEYIFRQNEDDGQAIYLISGKARLERKDNGDSAKVRDCEAGDFLGGLTLLGEKGRLFSLKSIADTTCLVLSREKFVKTMEQFPELMVKICLAVTQRIDTWEKRFLTEQVDQCSNCIPRLGVTLI